jgi:hypothetical protein
MDKRILSGCIASLIGLMLFASIGFLLGSKLNQVWATHWGELPLFDTAGVLLSMAVGGAIAGRRYVWFAIGLVALMWAATVVVLVSVHPEMTLAKVLHFNRLAIASSLVLACLGAWIGARLAERRGRRAAV